MKQSAWRAVLIFVLCLHVAGCDSSGEDSLFGTYRALRANGQSLPVDLFSVGGDVLGINGGWLRLRSDRTFGYSLDLFTRYREGGQEEETINATGEYTVTNTNLSFVDSEGDRFSGTIQGDLILVELDSDIRITFERD